MPRKKFKCPKCDRSFSMAAHLARHQNTMHASAAEKAARARVRGKARASLGRAPGRPSALSNRLGLRNLSIDQLAEVIEAARAEAQGKLADLQREFS